MADAGLSSHVVKVSNGAVTASTKLTVNAGLLDHLVLSPASAMVAFGAGQAYTAEGSDAKGNDLGDMTSTTTFSITPDGNCVGASCFGLAPDSSGAGGSNHTVTGMNTGKTGTAHLKQVGPLDHLVLSAGTNSIAAGTNVTYKAEGFDAGNNDLGDLTSSTTFSVAPDGSCTIATCTATVADTGGATHTVAATNGSVTKTAKLTVVPGPLDHLILSPAAASIQIGSRQTYKAEGFDAFGNDRGDATPGTTFTIADHNGAADGNCTAGAACGGGTATPDSGTFSHTVTGTDIGTGKTGTASLIIRPAS